MSRERMSGARRFERRNGRRGARLIAEALESRQLLALFTVNSALDSIQDDANLTLREAILAANLTPEADEIKFSIGANGGLQTIQLTSPLPPILAPVEIDGRSQPGFDLESPRPVIEINGAGAGVGATGLSFEATSGGSAVFGLAITEFDGDGIRLQGDGNRIAGNFLGLGLQGNVARGNVGAGLQVQSSRLNSIGGRTAAERNVISGNLSHGIRFSAIEAADTSGNLVLGNYIGTDVTGAIAIPNGGNGVLFFGGGGNEVGGTQPGSGNLISGNAGVGVEFLGSAASRNSVLGNLIGTDATGGRALGNGGAGVLGRGNANTVGGLDGASRNVISANRGGGVLFQGTLVEGSVRTGNLVQGNYVGTDASGTLALGNSGYGVRLFSDGNTIGGEEDGAGNLIANTVVDADGKGAGVAVAFSSRDNAILRNSISRNARLGIDLDDDGLVLANDELDADSSMLDGVSNEGQNYPVITAAESGGGVTVVRGTLNSFASGMFRVELFRNEVGDGSGFGEGETFLGTTMVSTSASGDGTFEFTLPTELPGGVLIAATATDALGNTSEFSRVEAVEELAAADLALLVTSTPEPVLVGTELEYQITVRNDGPEAATDVVVRVPLPLASQFISASGGATPDNGVVFFRIAAIESGAEATASLVVVPTVVGALEASFGVDAGTIDPDSSDNQVTVVSTVAANDDQSVVRFSAATYNGTESAGSVTITVERSNGASAVGVAYAVTAGSATDGLDFTAATGTLAFAAGEQVKTFDIELINDFEPEGTETILVTLSEPTGNAVLGMPFSATVLIEDDDPTNSAGGRIGLGAPTFIVVEGERVVNVPVVRSGGTEGDATIRFRTSDGTAVAGVDYEGQDFEVTFSDGDDAPKFILIPVTDDSVDEPDETFVATISIVSGTASLGGPSSAVVVIVDDDATPPPPEFQTVQFTTATYSAAENSMNAVVMVTRSASVGTVVVDIATSDGTARENDRYVPLAETLTFAPGELSRLVSIQLINTSVFEGDQTVNLTLSRPQGGTRLGSPSTAVLTIIDDEVPPPPPEPRPGMFNFTTSRFLVAETDGFATISVLRSDGDSGEVSVVFTTRGGSATPGVDYTSVTTTLTFADGETSKLVTVPIIDDGDVEGDEAVGLFLESPTGDATLGPLATAVLTIQEDDVDQTAPTVVDARLVGANTAITGLVFTFSEGMDPASAGNASNYQLVSFGRDGKRGTRDDRAIGIQSAAYDPATRSVTITPAAVLAARQTYSLSLLANGPGNLADAAGNLLDGDLNGIAGGSYSVTARRAAQHQYIDSNNDNVRIRLRNGGTLDVLRDASGEAVEVRVNNPRAGRSILSGSVKRRRGGDGVTRIGRLIGIDGFGVVRSRLKSPPFLIGSVSADGVDALFAGTKTARGSGRS